MRQLGKGIALLCVKEDTHDLSYPSYGAIG